MDPDTKPRENLPEIVFSLPQHQREAYLIKGKMDLQFSFGDFVADTMDPNRMTFDVSVKLTVPEGFQCVRVFGIGK